MTEGFPQATAADLQPHTIYSNSTPNDPHDILVPAAQKKWTALVQRAVDLHAAIPMGETVREAAEAVTVIQRRIADLTRVKSAGGFGLSDDAATVLAENAKLKRSVSERDRLRALYEVRGARWTSAKRLETNVRDWALHGRPADTVLDVIEDAAVSELLRKGERIVDAVERYRHRLRELAADLHRVKSAPWPSSQAKEKAKAQVEQLAEAATPNFDRAIEYGLPISFPMVSLSSLVHSPEPALAFTETVDVFGVLCWLFRDQMLAKCNAALDEIADDKAALSQQQREEMEAEISASVLAIERAEVACIWHAEAQNNEIIDFRADTSPQALLGVRLVNQPRAKPSPGTSPEHAFNIIGWRR